MTSNQDDGADVWWLKLRPLEDEVPGEVRMRRALKALLRVYRIKVLKVSGRGPDGEGKDGASKT
jgi:hypothetical protein